MSRRTPRAEGAANRQLLLPRGRARQQQVGDVGAGDQQHETDGAEQNQQRARDIADDLLVHRHQPHAEPCIGRILAFEPRGDPIHVRLRGAARDARAQAADDRQPERAARLHQLREPFRGCKWRPELRFLGVGEAFRHDADHLVRHAVEHHRAPDDSGIAAKSPLPEPVREDHGELTSRRACRARRTRGRASPQRQAFRRTQA